jgi:hypothetical protein
MGRHSVDYALQGVSLGLVVPDPPYPQTLLEADLSSTPTPLQQHTSSTQLPISHVCAVHATTNPKHFVFHCIHPRCHGRTFTRWYHFDRHYNGAHAAEKTVFWCPVRGCSRSEGGTGRPFPRRDKMIDHAAKMHGIVETDWMM